LRPIQEVVGDIFESMKKEFDSLYANSRNGR